MIAEFFTVAGGLGGLVRMAIAACLAAALMMMTTVPAARLSGEAAGRAALQSEIASAAAKAEKDRVKDDAHLRNLSDRDLCMRALSARQLPVDACAQL